MIERIAILGGIDDGGTGLARRWAQAGYKIVIGSRDRSKASTLGSVAPGLQGRILIDVTVPLMPPKVDTMQHPNPGCTGQVAQQLLGDDARVVSALQNVAGYHLQEGDELVCDVLVAGTDKDAREIVVGLVQAAGMRGVHAGPIANAAAAEALTSVLIQINRRYKCHAGIRITNLGESAS